MTYTDFTGDDLVSGLGLTLRDASLFANVAPLEPSQWLRDALHRGHRIPTMNEKSRSEAMVAPILLSCGDYLGPDYSVYSGVPLDVDAENGLRGVCDFALSPSPPLPFLQAPLLVIVEAKRGDIEASLPQCGAQMVAAARFNQKHDREVGQIHGCVTTGDDWRFLRLESQDLYVDRDRYYLSGLGKILGILVSIMKGSDKS